MHWNLFFMLVAEAAGLVFCSFVFGVVRKNLEISEEMDDDFVSDIQ